MSMAGRFAGKVALVTGGSKGIGKAIVSALQQQGAAVAYTCLPDDISGDAGQLDHENVIQVAGDMGDPNFCERAVEHTLERYGGIDLLVNNAFSFNSRGLGSSRGDWDAVMQIGPAAFSQMISLCTPSMIASGGGSIVNMSSISAFVAQPDRWTYNAAKGAVHQLTKCAAMDLGVHNIRVNSVSPGWTWTREVAKAAAQPPPGTTGSGTYDEVDGQKGDRAAWEPIWGKYSFLRRLGNADEVAKATLFLLSDDASYITGTDLAVDGGYCGMGPEGLGETSKFAAHET
eukprot:m.1146247 g.1146247  ORF g.1146247 m.1146247 type:complete len:287 (-) comp24466_c0_seq4:3562-4422(-)